MNFKISQISALQIFQLIRFSTLMLIGIVFTKSGLSTAEIGQYETFLFLAGAVSFFWLNGLIQGFLPSAVNNSTSGKSPAFFNLFYLLLALSVLSVLFILTFEHSISGFLLSGSGIPFLKYLLIYLLISTPASLVEYIYLIKKQSGMILIYGVLSFFLMFLLVVLPAVLGAGIQYSIAGLVISSVFRLIWLLIVLFQNSSPSFDFQFIQKHLKCAYPLIFSMFLSGSAQYIDGFIITYYFDEATFAIYRYGAREFPLAVLLANAFSSAMLPGFANSTARQSNLLEIRTNAQKLGSWLFPLSGVLLLASHWAFPIVFNVNFNGSATIFNIYLLLIVSRLVFPQTILIGLQKTKVILWASALEIAVNVGLSLCFVQYWGIAGVAYGTVGAYFFEKLILIAFVRGKLGYRLSSYLNVKQHLFYSLFLVAEFIAIEYLIY